VPPPGPPVIVSVTATPGGAGVVLFDAGAPGRVITDVTDVSQLEVQWEDGSWLPCDVIVSFDANSITLQGPSGIAAGRAWRVLSPMGVTWDGDPAVVMSVPEDGAVG
jgi:hypothetical protein